MKKKLNRKVSKYLEIQNFLKDNGISGIFYMPDYGTASLFEDEGKRLLILQHSKSEIKFDELKNLEKAESWMGKENKYKANNCSYIG